MLLHGRRRVLELLGLALLALLVLGCESAEQKCPGLRGAAAAAWGSYADVLSMEQDATQALLAAAKKKLEGEINQRHEDEARRQANELHGTEVSTAWYRTFLAIAKAQCSKDPECLELKVQLTEGEAKLADLGKRLAAVRAAQAAAAGASEAAKATAEAVPADPNRPSFEPAHLASAEANAVCADVKP